MKSDKLEQFVLDNRDGFDDLKPSENLWAKIEQDLPAVKEKKLSITTVLMRVAAVVVIFISSYFFHDFMNNNGENKQQANIPQSESFKTLVEAKMYYSSEIQFKKQELFQLTINTPEIQKSINAELEELDNLFVQLKEDLGDQANNDEVIEAMIQNYRIKLEILNQMLQQIKTKNRKNNNHEEIHHTL
ncbi:MAG: hypothetical protein C0598_05240 [Marinilabiliales bacterium]|nr:MAG: hypothetical protein C0598_05240 [Marinilabiliales bacterium]